MNKNANMIVPASLLDSTLQFINIASLTAKRAIDEVEVHRNAQKRAADLVPPLLEHMVAGGVIDGRRKEAAAAMLGSHAETLQLLKAAVDKLIEKDRELTKLSHDRLGEGVDPASIGLAGGSGRSNGQNYNSLEDPMIGRRTSEIRESDRPLRALAGLS